MVHKKGILSYITVVKRQKFCYNYEKKYVHMPAMVKCVQPQSPLCVKTSAEMRVKMNQEGMGRRQEKAMHSRASLLKAAEQLFSKKNINDVGVREIAAAAGVTTGTFYHYFKGKNDILRELYHNRDEEFGELLEKMAREGPYCPKIAVFFSEHLAEAVEGDGIDFTRHRMFQMQKHSREEHLLYVGIIRLLTKSIEAGEIKEEYKAEKINDYLFVVFRGVVYEWCICPEEERFNLPKAVRQAVVCALRSFVM